MPDSPSTRNRSAAIMWLLIVFAVTFDVAFLWQRVGGAYSSEFGAHPDEAAHYVTGLFVKDAVSALPSAVSKRSLEPLKQFGPDSKDGFYAHYPKVALGVWPPAFYMLQTTWALPFGSGRSSMLFLMATLAGAVGVAIYRAVRTESGPVVAVIAPIIWLSGPLIRIHYGMVMAEMLSTLTMFAATLFWGRYLDERRIRDAVWFGLFAASAILTKGTGLALALMVLFSIPCARAWSVIRAKGTWVAALLVLVLAGPWTWYFRKAGTQVGGWADNSGGVSVEFTVHAIPFYARHLALALGPLLFGLAVLGTVLKIKSVGPRIGRWAALSALVLGVIVFQCILPVGHEARHIISATPALVVLAVAGMTTLARTSRFRANAELPQQRREVAWAVGLLLITLPVFALARVEKKFSGFSQIADWLLAQSTKSRVLVCSDAVGEGMFISEVAMRDNRPGLSIERGSKALVDPKGRTWEGKGLQPRFDDAELLKFLESGKIEYIVLDSAVPEQKRLSYHDQLIRVIESNEPKFWQVLESPIVRDGEPMYRPLRLYRVKANANIFPK